MPYASLFRESGAKTDRLRGQAEIMGAAFSKKPEAYVYRYNTPNPTSGSPLVEHAAENWMMFRGASVA